MPFFTFFILLFFLEFLHICIFHQSAITVVLVPLVVKKLQFRIFLYQCLTPTSRRNRQRILVLDGVVIVGVGDDAAVRNKPGLDSWSTIV